MTTEPGERIGILGTEIEGMPRHYLVRQEDLRPIIETAGAEERPIGLAIGCACYGDCFNSNETLHVGKQLRKRGLVIALDPKASLATKSDLNSCGNETIGTPDWTIESPGTEVLVVDGLTTDKAIRIALNGRIDYASFTGPEPSNIAPAIQSVKPMLKPGSSFSMMFGLGEPACASSGNIERILMHASSSYVYSMGGRGKDDAETVLSALTEGMTWEIISRTFAEYKKQGLPLSFQVNPRSIKDEDILYELRGTKLKD